MGYNPLLFNGFVTNGGGGGGGGSSPTIGGPVTGGTDKSVLFIHPNGTLAQDNTNFNYDLTTHALTITGLLAASNFSGSSSGTNTGNVTIGTANGLSLSGQALSLQLATTSLTGAISSTDWNTFNNKQAAFTSQSQNLFFASPNGSSGIPTFRSIVASDLPSLSATYVPISSGNAAGGYPVLDGSGKVAYSQLPSSLMTFKGAWNAATNTPTLADGTGTSGDTYRASAAGTQNLGSGAQTWAIGDFVIYNGTIWQHSPAADGVSSVNGLTGAVTLTQGNLTDVGTDGITITSGTNAVWGSGTSIAQHVADTTHNGYLSSTDWNTFNGKQPAGNYATTDLSNLVSTSINQSLIPNSNNNFSLGSSSKTWANLHTSGANYYDTTARWWDSGGNTEYLRMQVTPGSAITSPSGATATTSIQNFFGPGSASNNILMLMTTSGTSSSNSGPINLETGNITGSGNSGSIILQTGTSSGGSRGVISLNGSSINANSSLINNITNPVSAQDAATKNYVDTHSSSGSPGDIAETSFSAANNQSSPANVTGFVFSNSVVRSFKALVSVYINATGSLYEVFDLDGIQRGADWQMSVTSTGDSSGIVFSITTAGQIQYTSSNITGFTANTVKFRALSTSI